jgi:hypothetical protein
MPFDLQRPLQHLSKQGTTLIRWQRQAGPVGVGEEPAHDAC